MAADIINLPSMRREQHDLVVKKIPDVHYSSFVETVLQIHRAKIYDSQDGNVKRLDRLPKFLRDQALKKGLPSLAGNAAMRFTSDSSLSTSEIQLMNYDHPLFKFCLQLAMQEAEQVSISKLVVAYPVEERLLLEVFSVAISDGTSKELSEELICLARRDSGQIVEVDRYWLFYADLEGELAGHINESDFELRGKANLQAMEAKQRFQAKRDPQSEQIVSFLRASFHNQYIELTDRLRKYQQDNFDNRNSALINQVQASLIDLEARREQRLNEVERQQKVLVKPPKCLAQIEFYPTSKGKATRLIPSDYHELIADYELANGRSNLKSFSTLGLVDFYSERYNGEPRYIILSNGRGPLVSDRHHKDLQPIIDRTYIYIVNAGKVVEERWLGELDDFVLNSGG